MLIPKDFILASAAEKEYGLGSGTIRNNILRVGGIKERECINIAGRWFVSRKAVERVYGSKQ